MPSRHRAREWALRVLYAHFMSGNPIGEVFEDILSGAESDPHLKFCRELCLCVAERRDLLDTHIQRAVEKWDLNRIAIVDHVILRMAIAEFLYFADIPFKVSINEAIELAKRYSTEQSGRFVNGILDALSAELQTQVQKVSEASVKAGSS